MTSTATLTRSGSTSTGFVRRSDGSVRVVTLANLSHYNLILVGYEGAGPGHRLPAPGTRLAPNDFLELVVAATPEGQHVTALFEAALPHAPELTHAYRLTVGSDPGQTRTSSTVPGSPIDELHLTQDDILLRDARNA